MANYYVLDCMSPLEAEHYRLRAGYPANDKRWKAGVLFSDQDKRAGFHPPTEPIEVQTKLDEDSSKRIYAELYWVPIPLMSRRLVAALTTAGVDNLQTYETKLITAPGKSEPQADYYLAVNIVGLISAADLANSKVNPEVSEKKISMDFYSLSVDAAKTHGLWMFRLAENISAVMVHEQVKQSVEAQGITTLSWLRPEEWAG